MKDITQKQKNKQSGVTLVMSLMILSLTIVSATALSRIILGEIRITLNATNALSAFYAADSAVEKALYYIKYNRQNGDNAPLIALGSVPADDFEIKDSLGNLSGQSFNFVNVNVKDSGFTFYNVSASNPAQVDIMDPSGALPSTIDWDSVNNDPHSFTLDWSIEDEDTGVCFPKHASDKLEITTYSFTKDIFLPDIDKDIVICDCTVAENILNNSCSSISKTISDQKYYRFSFRPLDATVKLLTVSIFKSSAPVESVKISSNIFVETDGIYKNSKYRLNVEVPALFSASNLFSYAIFSEEGLIKY